MTSLEIEDALSPFVERAKIAVGLRQQLETAYWQKWGHDVSCDQAVREWSAIQGDGKPTAAEIRAVLKTGVTADQVRSVLNRLPIPHISGIDAGEVVRRWLMDAFNEACWPDTND